MAEQPIVSAIVTAHYEAKLLIPAVQSVDTALSGLADKGMSTEFLVMLDRPDRATSSVLEMLIQKHEFSLHQVDFGDQGKVRNHAVDLASGEHIAFLDGDDLWSENWLVEAANLAMQLSENAVIYPEFNWFFEGSENVLCKVDETDDWFDIEALRSVNLWDALCFCPKQVYQQIRFADRKIKQGFAYEDWNWNRRVMEAGIKQRVARDTIIFKRRRRGSQGAEAQRRNVIAEPTLSSFYDYFSDR